MTTTITCVSIAWGFWLAVALLLDVIIFFVDDKATATATTRSLLSGKGKRIHCSIGLVAGAAFVAVTGWFESPSTAESDWMWWIGCVVMFTLMSLTALEYCMWSLQRCFKSEGFDFLISEELAMMTKTPAATFRQYTFGFIAGGLWIHFVW